MKKVLCGLFTLMLAGCAGSQPKASPPIAVKARQVFEENWSDQSLWLGSLSSPNSVIVKSEIAEKVLSIDFSEGKEVTKGELLVQLDNTKALARLKLGNTRLELAEANFKRAQGLFDARGISQKELDAAQAELLSAKANIELNVAELEDCQIVSPFDGIVTQKHIDEGEQVVTGTSIASVVQLMPLKLEFWVSEKYSSQVIKGNRVTFTVPSLPDQKFETQVEFISSQVDPLTRMVRVNGRYANERGLLKPGMSAQVYLEGSQKQAIVVPETAVVFRSEKPGVYIVDEAGTAHFQAIEIGLRREGLVEVVSGLTSKTIVVIEGAVKLVDGAQVTTRL
jgi:membrane fusion protein (multidrug efflux system)